MRVISKLNDYQDSAYAFAKYPTDAELQYLSLQLASEAGEVAGKIAKHFRDPAGYPLDKQAIALELGDVAWYVAVMALRVCGMTFAEVVSMNIAKLASRQDRGTLMGDGDNR